MIPLYAPYIQEVELRRIVLCPRAKTLQVRAAPQSKRTTSTRGRSRAFSTFQTLAGVAPLRVVHRNVAALLVSNRILRSSSRVLRVRAYRFKAEGNHR